MVLSVALKCCKDENRGIFYEGSERCFIYLPMHETLEDVYKTMTHEVIHWCLSDKCGVQFDETLDELQEESIIFNMQWAEVSL